MHGCVGDFSQVPAAGLVAPAVQRVKHHRIDGYRFHVQEVRAARGGEQQQPVREPAQPGQLRGDHPGVAGDFLAGGRLLDQFRVAERDRDGGAELVRGVLQEPALLLQQAQVLLGDLLDLFHRGQPVLHGCQAAPAMPDHHQEHQRDQRDFRQVVDVLLAAQHLDADDAPSGQRHRGQRQDGGLQPPQPEAVDRGQADPDSQERDGLPVREQAHRRQVEPGEPGPGQIHPRRPAPPQPAAQPRPPAMPRPHPADLGLRQRRDRRVPDITQPNHQVLPTGRVSPAWSYADDTFAATWPRATPEKTQGIP